MSRIRSAIYSVTYDISYGIAFPVFVVSRMLLPDEFYQGMIDGINAADVSLKIAEQRKAERADFRRSQKDVHSIVGHGISTLGAAAHR